MMKTAHVPTFKQLGYQTGAFRTRLKPIKKILPAILQHHPVCLFYENEAKTMSNGWRLGFTSRHDRFLFVFFCKVIVFRRTLSSLARFPENWLWNNLACIDSASPIRIRVNSTHQKDSNGS
jgi:hypothetical protein